MFCGFANDENKIGRFLLNVFLISCSGNYLLHKKAGPTKSGFTTFNY